MAAGQSTYNTDPDVAFPGMALDNGPRDVVSFTNEEAADALLGGLMVVQGTEADDALLPAATGDDPLGIVMHNHSLDFDLADGEVVAVDGLGAALKKGRIWVRVEEAIALGDDVYFRHTAAGAEQAGEFRTDADGGDADQLTNARWAGPSATYNGVLLAPLELNLP